MRKGLLFAALSLLVLQGCTTSAGQGAFAGAGLGSILGSAIGGIAGGPRGHDIGTIVGMAGGAAVGGAAGSSADRKRQEAYEELAESRRRRQNRRAAANVNEYEDSASGYDPSNGGDDRIYDFGSTDYTGNYTAGEPTVVMPESSSVDELVADYSYSPHVDIENARFVDENHDNTISRGETCKVIFEIFNRGSEPVYNVRPVVVDATANKQIYISPSLHIECIRPGRGVRYTAIVKAGKRLKEGSVKICASVVHGDDTISKVNEFNIATAK